MHGLPADADLSFLAGKRLSQIAVGANCVILYFDHGDPWIRVEGRSVTEVGGVRESSDDSYVIAPAMFPLIGRKVLDVTWEESGTIRLMFDDSGVVIIEDDSPHYESYQIVLGDLEITV